MARSLSFDSEFMSPFSVNARRNNINATGELSQLHLNTRILKLNEGKWYFNKYKFEYTNDTILYVVSADYSMIHFITNLLSNCLINKTYLLRLILDNCNSNDVYFH